MSGPALLFREIHRLRRFARDLQDHIERHPRLLKIQQAKVARQEEIQRDNLEAIKKLKVSIGQKELNLKTNNGLIAKYQKGMDTASSMKEMDAFRSQTATAQAKCKEIEDEILTEMNEIEERTARLPELDQAVRQAHEEYARFEKAQGEKHADHVVQLQQALDQLQKIEKELPDSIRNQYERTIASMGPDGLSCARLRICEACRTQITLQTQQDLKQYAFVVCSACGRILYPAEVPPDLLAKESD
jgi:uncharacterized protein